MYLNDIFFNLISETSFGIVFRVHIFLYMDFIALRSCLNILLKSTVFKLKKYYGWSKRDAEKNSEDQGNKNEVFKDLKETHKSYTTKTRVYFQVKVMFD